VKYYAVVLFSLLSCRAGSVSVFRVGIWYFRRYFSHVVSVSVSVFLEKKTEILVENRKFLVPHLYLAPLLRVTPSKFHSRVPFWKTRMMEPPGDEKV